MKKKALLAALLAMTLLLSSCALIVKDMEVDAATVILQMGDKTVTKAEVQAATNDVLEQMASTYASYGIALDTTDPDTVARAQESAVAQLKQDMVLRAKIVELGFDELSEEEIAAAQEAAESDMEYARAVIPYYYLDDPNLEGEELEQAVQAKMDELGITLESYVEIEQDNLKMAKLREYAVKDVTVPDEEVRAEYDSKVAADQEAYAEDAVSWTTADRNGTTLYYTPAGIRRVKQILLKFKSDDQAAITAANTKITQANSRVTAAETIINDPEADEESKAQAQEDLAAAQADLEAAQAELKAATDAAFANLDADADAILEALAADPDSWDQLMEEKNEDTGLKAGAINAEKGYAICEGMTSFDAAFTEAALALANVGDISGKVRGETFGYFIIKYVSDDAEGPVDYDSVKDAIHSTLLSAKQTEAYNAAVDQWISEAGIREDLGALNN